MTLQADVFGTDELTLNLLDFMKNSSAKTPKLPPQASLTSQEEKKAYMLNRVQQARFERELMNISKEKKFQRLSNAYAIQVMARKQELIEKSKERVAKENAHRRNLEDIQRLAEDFFDEQRRRDSLAYNNFRYNMNFIEAMTSSKLNQLLQTTLPEPLIDKMLGQEKVRQQRRTLFQPQISQRTERKPRTMFELIQMLKEQGKLKVQSIPEASKQTEFVRISERSRQLSERSRMRWKKAFTIIVSKHREARHSAQRDRPESCGQTSSGCLRIRRAVTCPLITKGHTAADSDSTDSYYQLPPRQRSGRNSTIVRVRSSRPVSGTDAKARVRGLLAQERTKQQQMKLKINKYYKTLEDPATVDTQH